MAELEAIENELKRFGEAERAAAREALPKPSELPPGAPHDRVLLAILTLAGCNLEKGLLFAARARADWRDVLYWAEQPADASEPRSWEELEKRLGFKDE